MKFSVNINRMGLGGNSHLTKALPTSRKLYLAIGEVSTHYRRLACPTHQIPSPAYLTRPHGPWPRPDPAHQIEPCPPAHQAGPDQAPPTRPS